jgi:hypothetical protein
MHPDPRETLHVAAAVPDGPPDLDRLYARGRRHGRNRRLAAVTAPLVVFAVLVSTVLAVRPMPDPPPAAAPTGLFDGLRVGWNVLPPPPSMSDPLAAAWTGQGLLVWARGQLPSGEVAAFAFDARSRGWRTTAEFPLTPRDSPTWAWTGRELLVWGGVTYDFDSEVAHADGAAYDPATDSWRTLPKAPIDGRAPLWVWTGRELIVWGGQMTPESATEMVYDGAAYDPVRDTWRRTADAPVALANGSAAWTDREMIVVGVAKTPNGGLITDHLVTVAYDPSADTWRRLPDLKEGAQVVTTAWDGTELIAVTEGWAAGAYDPARNAWRSLPGAPPRAECGPQNPTVDGRVYMPRCISSATGDVLGVYSYDRTADRWADHTIADPPISPGVLVGAGPVLMLVGRTSPAGDSVMYAYRPPG